MAVAKGTASWTQQDSISVVQISASIFNYFKVVVVGMKLDGLGLLAS